MAYASRFGVWLWVGAYNKWGNIKLKLLVNGKEIKTELIRLINSSDNFEWSVAWASHASECYDHLIKCKSKISRMVVGTHFYQTHPQFLKEFSCNEKVRIIEQPSGVFHPKVYYFEFEDGSWECILGSPNFTKSAFELNEEIAVLIASDDSDASDEIDKLRTTMNSFWDSSTEITDDFIKKYEALWKKKNIYVKKLAGDFGTSKPKRKDKFKDAFLGSEISTLEWDYFAERVVRDDQHSLDGRLNVINSTQGYFEKHEHFQLMPLLNRKRVAGLLTETNIDWKWFGSMVGAGRFKNRVNANDEFISLALDCIPLTGEVYRENYEDFKELYMHAFGGKGNYLATATRLLAMKRPDYFVCLDSANKEKFCKDFSVPKSLPDIHNYWDEIVERVMECVWWGSLPPKDKTQREIWNARAAFLDALYYVPLK